MKRFIRQAVGMSGAAFGISARGARTFAYSFAAIAILVGVVNVLNIITLEHATHSFAGPFVGEGSSWVTLLLFLWVPWLAWRMARPEVRPRWKLLVHVPAAIVFVTAHVAGFDLLRAMIYAMAGEHYAYGPFLSQLLYEARKDLLGYALFIGLFSLIDYLLRQQGQASAGTATFDIRDGARLTRVRLDEILAVSSAGNYVEFFLADGRRLLMRAPLRNVEHELTPRGFVRTHRSWLVNGGKVTTLKPDGSGDYTVELGRQSVPLSRRFPGALAKLRGP